MKRYKNSLVIILSFKTAESKNGKPLPEKNDFSNLAENLRKDAGDRAHELFAVSEKDTVYPANFFTEQDLQAGLPDGFTVVFDRKKLADYQKYSLVIRNMTEKIGTIEVPLKKIIRPVRSLKGISS